MTDLLIRNADAVVTMNAARAEVAGADVHVRDGVIRAIGVGLAVPGAEVIEAKGCVVTPGLVNTHHHLYQTLTRAVPGGQDALLFGWLKTLYPIWSRFGPEEMFTSAQVGLAELALSGCTMTSDHLYLDLLFLLFGGFFLAADFGLDRRQLPLRHREVGRFLDGD
ncbi:MAG: amidohydrolase family protein, partial [Rhodobacterales bacterium]|nr:amidohydrolase family protein [Rhodobacterales bacterium]